MNNKPNKLADVCWERCRYEDSKKLFQRWLPVLERYARIFNIRIVADLPNGEQSVISKEAEEPVLYIHFNSYPVSGAKTRIIKNPSFFGLAVEGDVSLRDIEFRHQGWGVAISSPPGKIIKSPENFPVGFISSGNLYIYPGILGTPYWSDNQDLHILNAILYWTIPNVIDYQYSPKDIYRIYSETYGLVKLNMRKNLHSKRGKRLCKSTELFLSQSLRMNIERLYGDLSAITKEIDFKRSQYFKSLEKVYELEERLECAVKKNETSLMMSS